MLFLFSLDVIQPKGYNGASDAQDRLRENFVLPSVRLDRKAQQIEFLPRTPWFHQFKILMRRSFKEQMRSRTVIITQLINAIVMAIFIGTAFLKIGVSQSSIARRGPVVFFCAINQGMFAALQTVNSFPSERLLVLRERAAGTYYISAYFVAKNIAESLMQILCPIIFSCIVYFLIGLQADAGKFFIFMAFMILCSLAATSLALAVSALARTTINNRYVPDVKHMSYFYMV